MKEIFFDEGDLNNLEKIKDKLCEDDENDPRSLSYKRVLKRPSINWFKVVLFLLVIPSILISLAFILYHFGLPLWMSIVIAIILFFIYILITLKRAIICSVKIYQRYAPDHVRNKCRFEPSCSEYMILAIEKYGVFKGLKKGINRIKRCNVNNGGYDYP